MFLSANTCEGGRSDKGDKRTNGKIAVVTDKKIVKKKQGRVKQDADLIEYNKEATFRQKVVFAIRTANHFIGNRAIAEFIFKHEQDRTVEELVERFSAIASRFKLDGYIVSHQAGSLRNTFYGLPNWLDENKRIRKGYEYNAKNLVGKKAELV